MSLCPWDAVRSRFIRSRVARGPCFLLAKRSDLANVFPFRPVHPHFKHSACLCSHGRQFGPDSQDIASMRSSHPASVHFAKLTASPCLWLSTQCIWTTSPHPDQRSNEFGLSMKRIRDCKPAPFCQERRLLCTDVSAPNHASARIHVLAPNLVSAPSHASAPSHISAPNHVSAPNRVSVLKTNFSKSINDAR